MIFGERSLRQLQPPAFHHILLFTSRSILFFYSVSIFREASQLSRGHVKEKKLGNCCVFFKAKFVASLQMEGVNSECYNKVTAVIHSKHLSCRRWPSKHKL